MFPRRAFRLAASDISLLLVVSVYSICTFCVLGHGERQQLLVGKVMVSGDPLEDLRVYVQTSSVASAHGPSQESQVRPVIYPVFENASHLGFGLFHLSELSDGDHVLEVCCSQRFEYFHQRITIENGDVIAVEERKDPLSIPGGYRKVETNDVVFHPRATLHFSVKRRRPWSLFRHFTKPYVLFQLLAGIFVVWFPRHMATIDPDMLAELTGEQPVDTGDPNALLKRLVSLHTGSASSAQT